LVLAIHLSFTRREALPTPREASPACRQASLEKESLLAWVS